MARATFVKSAQKDIYENGKYVKYTSEKGKRKGQEITKLDRTVPKDANDKVFIAKGESYYWWAFKNGGKHFSKTQPKASQLTQSAYLGTLYDIQDTIDNLEATEQGDLEAAVDEIKSELESLKDQTEESLSNMPDSLQSSPTGELLQERIDTLDSAISELESIDLEIEEPDVDDIRQELIDEEDSEDEDWTPPQDEVETRMKDRIIELLEEKIQEVQSISIQ